MAGRRQRREASRPAGAGRALLWTIGSLVLPGIAHLRVGRRATGGTILAVYLGLVATVVTLGVIMRDDLALSAKLAVQGQWLFTAGAVVFVGAVLWMTIIVHSWVITRPPGAGRFPRFAGGTMVLVLCLVIAAPAAAAMHTAYTAYDTISDVFGPESGDEPHDASNPWNGRDRVNVLLLGGDSGSNRYGMRTDSMIIASMDVHTGDTVLIGLPRNMENTQFPPGSPLAESYPPPNGFDKLLNEVYQTVAEHPKKLADDPSAPDPAADTFMNVVSYLTDLQLDYYALVDMEGFEGLIDAIGGITVHIDQPIPYGQEGDVLEKGTQHLSGYEALWYGRSRVNSDDYTRMGRQGCLLKYVAEQTEPTQVLTSYRELAGATKRTLRTDIPKSKVPAFIELADLVTEKGEMRTLQLTPPQVNTAYPDWKKIRNLVADAVKEQEDRQKPENNDDVTPDSSPSKEASPSAGSGQGGDETEWQEYSGQPAPTPTTPGRQVGDDPASLDKLCP